MNLLGTTYDKTTGFVEKYKNDGTVSYTHLDVYKRQAERVCEKDKQKSISVKTAGGSSV